MACFMRGTIILSEARSGTNWLGGLATSTGQLGRSGEWVDPVENKIDFLKIGGAAAAERVVELSATPNGVFLFKVFPYQLQRFHAASGLDPLIHIAKTHDVQFLRLERRDRLGQAISHARAAQTQAWRSDSKSRDEPVYDFDLICRRFFQIGRSHAFWKAYLDLLGRPAAPLFYEDQLPDGGPFLRTLTDHAGVTLGERPETHLKIQRDATNDAWRERFIENLRDKDIFAHAAPSRVPYRRLSNIVRLLRGKQLKPYPESYFWQP